MVIVKTVHVDLYEHVLLSKIVSTSSGGLKLPYLVVKGSEFGGLNLLHLRPIDLHGNFL